MKKFLTCLLTLAVLVSMLAVTAAASNDGAGLMVTAREKDGKAVVEIVAARAVSSYSLTLNYDSSVLTYKDTLFLQVEGGETATSVQEGEGSVTLGFAAPSSLAAVEGQPLATVEFAYFGKETTLTPVLEELNGQEGLHLTLPQVNLSGELPFTDVPKGAWYYDAVMYGYKTGLFQGVTDTIFQPQGTMSRAMFVTTLARMAEAEVDNNATTQFTDVKPGSYYAGAVAWAVEAGIVKGTSATTFSPNAEITREQMVTMLCRYARMQGEDTAADMEALKQFDDNGKISRWARGSMAWAVEQHIVVGTDKGLEPLRSATRAEGAQVLMTFGLR